nr:folylpolyglutamate synthase isoform X1 [Ipomoea batatas]
MEKLNNEKVEETSQVKEVTSTYEYAMEKLSSLITRKKRDGKSTISEIEKRERMLSYIEILGLEKQIAGLKIIHVAGTKGKGSTCAFCEAILRECGFRTGLFTSPHLIDVRERFRLDGLDISEEKFLQYFWEIWNQLKDNIVEGLPMPPLFQFLTLLAFKIFASEKVDVAIIEVGIGGTFDSTNVIKEPVVCGITSLGMDHMEILGDTLGKIASHKAGILKLGVPAFTVPQPSEAMEVLYDRAQKLMVTLKVVTPLDSKVLKDVKLILSGDHQLTNAALAISLCKSWLKTTGSRQLENADWDETLPHKFLIGLSSAHLSGRAQIVQDDTIKNSSGVNGSYPGGLTFYLDGAHSPESMEACARWFSAVVGENKNLSHLSSCSKNRTPKKIWVNGCIQDGDKQEPYKMSKQILLFNCMDVRDPQILLSRLVNTCASSGTHFSKAIFVPSMSAYNKVTSGTSTIPLNIPQKDLSWQFNLQRVWERICCGKDVHVLDQNLNTNTSGNVPPCKFLYKDASSCSQGDEYFGSSVFPSLPLTINWLRNCAKENPSSRIQVLVTGSLHLVGDALRLLKR